MQLSLSFLSSSVIFTDYYFIVITTGDKSQISTFGTRADSPFGINQFQVSPD